MTPLWVEAAETRQLIEGAGNDEAGARRFRLTDHGRQRLAEIEDNWSLLNKDMAAEGQARLLRGAWAGVLVLAGGTAVGVTAAIENLRTSPVAWAVVAVFVCGLALLLIQRLRKVRRTHEDAPYYWLYSDDRKAFRQWEGRDALDVSELLDEAKQLSADLELDRRMVDAALRALDRGVGEKGNE